MEIYSLSSGSKANCTLVITNNYNLLIDVGGSKKKIEEGLMMACGLGLHDIDMILLTHS